MGWIIPIYILFLIVNNYFYSFTSWVLGQWNMQNIHSKIPSSLLSVKIGVHSLISSTCFENGDVVALWDMLEIGRGVKHIFWPPGGPVLVGKVGGGAGRENKGRCHETRGTKTQKRVKSSERRG